MVSILSETPDNLLTHLSCMDGLNDSYRQRGGSTEQGINSQLTAMLCRSLSNENTAIRKDIRGFDRLSAPPKLPKPSAQVACDEIKKSTPFLSHSDEFRQQ